MNKPTLILISSITVVAISVYKLNSQPQELISPLATTVVAYEAPTPNPKPRNILLTGKSSHYSHAGCLGCSEGQIMGNGEAFDENANTIAVPCEMVKTKKNPNAKIAYWDKNGNPTKVRVTNTETGASEIAIITDCGGFSKYNRVADLSKGLAEKLNVKTDKTNIEIEKL